MPAALRAVVLTGVTAAASVVGQVLGDEEEREVEMFQQ